MLKKHDYLKEGEKKENLVTFVIEAWILKLKQMLFLHCKVAYVCFYDRVTSSAGSCAVKMKHHVFSLCGSVHLYCTIELIFILLIPRWIKLLNLICENKYNNKLNLKL